MPKYTFECAGCSLRFERNLKMGRHDSHACPECGDAAASQPAGFGFAFEAKADAPKGNTGVHDHDYPTADKAVGRSAESRWDHYHRRDQVKRKVREVTGVRELRRRNGNGYIDYESMNDKSMEARGKLLEDARAAVKIPSSVQTLTRQLVRDLKKPETK